MATFLGSPLGFYAVSPPRAGSVFSESSLPRFFSISALCATAPDPRICGGEVLIMLESVIERGVSPRAGREVTY